MPGTGIFSLKPFLLRKRSGSCDSNYSQKIGFSETRLLAFQGGQVEGNEDVPPPFRFAVGSDQKRQRLDASGFSSLFLRFKYAERSVNSDSSLFIGRCSYRSAGFDFHHGGVDLCSCFSLSAAS